MRHRGERPLQVAGQPVSEEMFAQQQRLPGLVAMGDCLARQRQPAPFVVRAGAAERTVWLAQQPVAGLCAASLGAHACRFIRLGRVWRQDVAQDQQLCGCPGTAGGHGMSGAKMCDRRSHLGKSLLQRVPGCFSFSFGAAAKGLLLPLTDRYPAGHGRIVPDGEWTDMFHRVPPFGLVIGLFVFGEVVLADERVGLER